MSYICQNCGFVTEKLTEECSECGGLLEEAEPVIDWLGEGEGDHDEDKSNEPRHKKLNKGKKEE
ncbi:MAG TPA: hypothetical protein VJJ80_03965 [Patescibacteria group bacterium]|nr:hypothetical protein [Patescibacteria group bacterium]